MVHPEKLDRGELEAKPEPDIEEVIAELKGKGGRKKQDELDGKEGDGVSEELGDEERGLEEEEEEEEDNDDDKIAGPSKRQKLVGHANNGNVHAVLSDSDDAFEFEAGKSLPMVPQGKLSKTSVGKEVAGERQGRGGKGKKK